MSGSEPLQRLPPCHPRLHAVCLRRSVGILHDSCQEVRDGRHRGPGGWSHPCSRVAELLQGCYIECPASHHPPVCHHRDKIYRPEGVDEPSRGFSSKFHLHIAHQYHWNHLGGPGQEPFAPPIALYPDSPTPARSPAGWILLSGEMPNKFWKAQDRYRKGDLENDAVPGRIRAPGRVIRCGISSLSGILSDGISTISSIVPRTSQLEDTTGTSSQGRSSPSSSSNHPPGPACPLHRPWRGWAEPASRSIPSRPPP